MSWALEDGVVFDFIQSLPSAHDDIHTHIHTPAPYDDGKSTYRNMNSRSTERDVTAYEGDCI